MIAYIIQLIETIELRQSGREAEPKLRIQFGAVPDIKSLVHSLYEEMGRLDPRDFEPSRRNEFLVRRSIIRTYCNAGGHVNDYSEPVRIAALLKETLEHYQGEGSHKKIRDFSFVSDPNVRIIVERDYRELALRTFPDGSWKSTVILAGSILEAVLYDLLTKDPATINRAMTSTEAPKKRGGRAVKDITRHGHDDQWTLNDLIKVSCNLQLLPQEDELAIHVVLRDYRNFVHPRLEIEMGLGIGDGHATAAKGMLDLIVDHLSRA